jgi:archaellum component FlaC
MSKPIVTIKPNAYGFQRVATIGRHITITQYPNNDPYIIGEMIDLLGDLLRNELTLNIKEKTEKVKRHIEEDVERLRHGIEEIRDETRELRNDVEGIRERARDLKSEVEEFIDQFKDDAKSESDKVVGLSDEIKELSNEVESVKERINEIIDNVQSLLDSKRMGIIDSDKQEYIKGLKN